MEPFYPAAGALEALVRENGINGFYHSTEARHACCAVRKIEPLARALHGAAAWLTGLRADQSGNRQALDFATFDAQHRLLKVNPLLDWSRDQVASFVRDQDVPYNTLHDQRIPLDRLRPVHPRRRTRRAGTSRPLVVGTGSDSRMRPASDAGWSPRARRGSRYDPSSRRGG